MGLAPLRSARRRLLLVVAVCGALAAALGATYAVLTEEKTESLGVTANSTFAPVNVSPPTITGTLSFGSTLTAHTQTGDWTNTNVAPTFTYRWTVCAAVIGCVLSSSSSSNTVVLNGTSFSGLTSLLGVTSVQVAVTAANPWGSTVATAQRTS